MTTSFTIDFENKFRDAAEQVRRENKNQPKDDQPRVNGQHTKAASAAIGTSWDEPDVSILDDRRGELPEFPLDVLEPACLDWVVRSAHGAGVTPAHVVVPLLGITSSLIGTARRVQPSRAWTQPFTTWTAIVGFSGSGKTPGLDTVKRAVARSSAPTGTLSQIYKMLTKQR